MSAFHCISYDSLSLNPEFRDRVDAARIALENLLAEAMMPPAPTPAPTPEPAPEPTAPEPTPSQPSNNDQIGYLQTLDGKRLGLEIPSRKDAAAAKISLSSSHNLWKMSISEEILHGNTSRIARFLNLQKINNRDCYLDRKDQGRKGETRVHCYKDLLEMPNNPAQRWILEATEGGFRLSPSYKRGRKEYLKITDTGETICGKEGEAGDIFTFVPA